MPDAQERVDAIVEAGKTAHIDNLATNRLEVKGDRELIKRTMLVQKTKYRTHDDIKKKFPFPDELEELDGAFWFNNRMIVPTDERDAVLSAIWKDMPSSTGRIRFYAYVRSQFYGISSVQCQNFLKTRSDHQVRYVYSA